MSKEESRRFLERLSRMKKPSELLKELGRLRRELNIVKTLTKEAERTRFKEIVRGDLVDVEYGRIIWKHGFNEATIWHLEQILILKKMLCVYDRLLELETEFEVSETKVLLERLVGLIENAKKRETRYIT